MTEPERAVIARLSSDVAAISAYLARASADLRHLEHMMAERSAALAPQAPSYWQPSVPEQPTVAQPAPVLTPLPGGAPQSDGWIGKVLAVAGVAVTLVGVALLLVLAAQAGILRPEFRVFAGGALAAGLVATGWRLEKRPGGRVGAIALAATGIAAAYIDVIAVTTIYHWVSAPVGLAIAAAVAGSGLALARRWDSEQLGLLILVPLIGLAPVVADGFTLLLVGFMLALSAASVPIQFGRDWVGLHAARTAVSTLPLLIALAAASFDGARSPLLTVACCVAGGLAIGSALTLLAHSRHSLAMGVLSAVGTTPVLAASLAADAVVAAPIAGALSATLLGLVLAKDRLAMVTPPVRTVWSALAAASALVAVTVAFDGPVAGPVVLAMALAVGTVGRRGRTARWCALGLGVTGGAYYGAQAPLTALAGPTPVSVAIAVSTLVSSLLVIACGVVAASTWRSDWAWTLAAVVGLYGATTFAVTTGVLLGGDEQGFYGGHVVATICWIVLAAAAFRHAARRPKVQRSVPIGAALALVAAAVVKLFVFDLAILDGIFRVVVFIVVGLALLGMGAGFARLLAQPDDREPIS